MTTFQIIFTPMAASEIARMPKELQLQILGEFRGLPSHVIGSELDDFGKLESDGHILHRYRVGDYRIYFERHQLGILVHRVLSKNTLKDFFFRSGIKMGEDQALQENPKFWQLIEAAKSS
jgi:mRNA-degrading endonuclease RelE of RelBE toxin-antitoxin system